MNGNYDRQPIAAPDEASIHNRISAILKRAENFSCLVVQPLSVLPYPEFLSKYPKGSHSQTGQDQMYTPVLRREQGLGIKEPRSRLTSSPTRNEFLLRLLADSGSNQFIYLEPKAVTLKDNNTLMVVNHAEGRPLDELLDLSNPTKNVDLRNACIRPLIRAVTELHRLGITHNDQGL